MADRPPPPPAWYYRHAAGVFVPAGVAAVLEHYLGQRLDEYRTRYGGRHPEADIVLKAIRDTAAAWQNDRRGNIPQQPIRLWDETYTTTQAAVQLRMTPRGVLKAIKSGRLPAALVDGRWRITREALALFRDAT